MWNHAKLGRNNSLTCQLNSSKESFQVFTLSNNESFCTLSRKIVACRSESGENALCRQKVAIIGTPRSLRSQPNNRSIGREERELCCSRQTFLPPTKNVVANEEGLFLRRTLYLFGACTLSMEFLPRLWDGQKKIFRGTLKWCHLNENVIERHLSQSVQPFFPCFESTLHYINLSLEQLLTGTESTPCF